MRTYDAYVTSGRLWEVKNKRKLQTVITVKWSLARGGRKGGSPVLQTGLTSSPCNCITLTYAPGEHKTACLDEVQKLKTESAEGVPEFTSGTSSSESPSCIATLSLSGIGFLYCILTSMVLS